jgi:hypothetical protein
MTVLVKRELPAASAPVTPLAAEQQVMGTPVTPEPSPALAEGSRMLAETLHKEISSAQIPTQLVPRPGKKREPQLSRTYRLPEKLVNRLERVCNYNNLKYYEFVAEAIDRHLDLFEQPPDDMRIG